MTAHEIATAWAAPVARIRYWCRRDLLTGATRTSRGWQIPAHVRPPYRDSRMIYAWLQRRGETETRD